MPDVPSCTFCGGRTQFAAAVQGSGTDPAYLVVFCEVCQRHTWTQPALTERKPEQFVGNFPPT